MTFIDVLDLLGTISFAASGALTALEKKLDPFGILIIGFVTAAGGGTLRDILLGVSPVKWLLNLQLVIIVFVIVIITIIFRRFLLKLRTTLFLFDTIGIGLYTIVGLQVAIAAGLHPVMCVTIGTINACFGGVIRDILCNEIPVLFRQNIYATACIAGGGIYFLLQWTNLITEFAYVFAGSAVLVIRLLAVKYGLQLPSPYPKNS